MTLKSAQSRVERIKQSGNARRARLQSAGEQAESLQRAHEVLGIETAAPTPRAQAQSAPRADGAQPNLSAIWLSVEQLQLNPIYGRSIFDESVQQELNASVAEHGVLEPVLVRPLSRPNGLKTHELVAGYRRVRAAQSSGQEIVPAMERRMDNVEAAQISVSENLQRQNPHPGDIGLALLNLKEQMQKAIDEVDAQNARAVRGEGLPSAASGDKAGLVSSNYFKSPPKLPAWMDAVFQHAHATGRKPRVRWEDVSERVALNKRTLMYYIDIAKLPADIMEQVAPVNSPSEGKLSARQARAIASAGDEKQQRALFKRTIKHGWTGDQIAAHLRNQNQNSDAAETTTETTADDAAATPVFPTAALQTMVRAIAREDKSATLLQIAEALENDDNITPAYADAVTRDIERIRAARASENELLTRIERTLERANERAVTSEEAANA